jgi:hypothetical protein
MTAATCRGVSTWATDTGRKSAVFTVAASSRKVATCGQVGSRQTRRDATVYGNIDASAISTCGKVSPW